MTDYNLPAEVDTSGFEQASIEEKFRRAKDLADLLFERLPPGGPAEELASLMYELGLDLDRAYGLNITGGDAA